VLADLGIALDVRRLLAEAPVSVRQMVEIAKAISLEARVLLLDEPTAALSPVEAERLFALIGRLSARGLGIVYISHHLSEVLKVADRITVLRDGSRRRGTLPRRDRSGGPHPRHGRARRHRPQARAGAE
jgi:ribose transport system ATP-binding protein